MMTTMQCEEQGASRPSLFGSASLQGLTYEEGDDIDGIWQESRTADVRCIAERLLELQRCENTFK